MAAAPPPTDIYRDTPVRFLGYANEVGESFKPVAPRALYFGSYAVACAYVAADAKHKYDRDGNWLKGVDALVWQALASVAVPGLVVNRVVAAAGAVTKRPMVPTLCGLASIPVIIKPIDWLVDEAMDATLRPWLHAEK
mmetsp:Transcript_22725/g.68230  ORF Transcript_22725/g.68230 Transcript_22725/m.68230 type:complete len:138 (-) Transcript_22725:22-435(-)